jgi:cell division protein FtsI/penicillin-binding protein 2
MQMHQAMGVIASGGVLLRPQVIKQVSDPSGEIVHKFDRVEVRRVVSERTARTMAQLLMGVASKEGTAPEAAIPGYEVAGKTGTTQKIVDGHYSTTHHVASFVGFFPASRPQVAISVIVDDADAHCPGGVAYGKSVAAPSFKHIGEQLISYLRINAGGAPVASNLVALGGSRR